MAGKGKRIHVVSTDTGWAARREGQRRAVGIAPTQEAAQQLARQTLEIAPQGGEMITHRRNGRIRESDIISRRDPHPPKG